MKRRWGAVLFLSFVVGFVSDGLCQGQPSGPLKITTAAFENNGSIPKSFGCAGRNINPPLKIENVPPRAKSLALMMDDLDAPGGGYVHWILWNIDPTIKEMQEDSVPEGAVQGTNDFKKRNYGGPCPPTRPHRYLFKIIALDTLINLRPESTKAGLQKAMKEHILAEARIIGRYSKK